VSESTDPSLLDEAVRTGVADLVDFRTPVEDAEFYRGVDVVVGHVVAGLPLPRPEVGYKNAIDDQLQDARSMLDAFHVVKLATQVVDDVRRRVCSRTPPVAAVGGTTRSIGSATSCAPVKST
jgi:hypothetical protein